MTTKKYDTLSERAGKLCIEYVECARVIEEVTTLMMMHVRVNDDYVSRICSVRRRKSDILYQLAQLETLALETLSNREYARYFRYVSVMLSPLTEH